MTNHVHFLLTPQTEQGISKAMQMLGRYYVQYFNRSYNRTGTLWEGRYKATLIDTENYLLTCYRYIELNPVRAEGMVEHPSEYPWSSDRYNALGQVNALVAPHSEYTGLGKTGEERQAAYRSLFQAWVLGSNHFKQKIANQLNRPVSPASRGGDRRSKAYKQV